jgi:hypothetical protein
MTKIAGSGSGSISQRHGSADPDPHQNVMDPEHCGQGNCPTSHTLTILSISVPVPTSTCLSVSFYANLERAELDLILVVQDHLQELPVGIPCN